MSEFVPIQMALRPEARICGAYPAIGYGRINVFGHSQIFLIRAFLRPAVRRTPVIFRFERHRRNRTLRFLGMPLNFRGFFKTFSFMLLALLSHGINPMDSSQKLAYAYSICGFLEECPDSK